MLITNAADVPSALQGFFDTATIALSLAQSAGDTPLIAVNRPFRELTGYADADVLGKNCRFLQRDVQNEDARQALRAFLQDEEMPSTRQFLVNFKADGTPFVNLLYMSRLRLRGGGSPYFFASQFNVSKSYPEKLEAYDASLQQALSTIEPAVSEAGIIIEGSLTTVANSAAMIAQAKVTLAEVQSGSVL